MAAAQLVSVLVPCHDAAPWLAETLDSALAQSWPRVEVICVDDGSTDGTISILERYERRGVKLVRQTRAGASAARNRALREAQGAFIQYLDADDLLSPDKIAAQVERLRSGTPNAIASCAWGRFRAVAEDARFVDQAVFRDFDPLEFLMHCADTGDMVHPGAWLVPRAVAERAGPWDESLTVNDDGEYFCRAILASDGILFTPGARSFYRSGSPGSLSQRRDERSARSQFRSVELMAAHLRSREDSVRTRRAAANYYQRYLYDFYPGPPDVARLAEQRIGELGGASAEPAMGPVTRAVSRVVGWKGAWRLRAAAAGLRGVPRRGSRGGNKR